MLVIRFEVSVLWVQMQGKSIFTGSGVSLAVPVISS
jgi:hypothetical protein